MIAGTAARAELYAALRGNAWVREAFGDQPATLWSLARDVAQLSDELTWAAVDSPDAFEGRLAASLARHFHRRAARALRPQAQLVLQLWRARRSAGDGCFRRLARARGTRFAGHGPAGLCVARCRDRCSGRRNRSVGALLCRAMGRVRARTLAGARPCDRSEWPAAAGRGVAEIAGTEVSVPIAERADAVRGEDGARRLRSLSLTRIRLRTRPPRWRGRCWRGGARASSRLRLWLSID